MIRVARLKALGNAVDPLQAYPVLVAIKKIDDYVKSGRSWYDQELS